MIIPCAGRSSRFPNMKPKWLLEDPLGRLMVARAFEGIRGIEIKDLIIVILKEHDEKYDASKTLRNFFGEDLTIIVLPEPTSSQSETIYQAVMNAKITGSFFVKDCDNYFEVNFPQKDNGICYALLEDYPRTDPNNKSYIKMDNSGKITEMIEKQVVSSSFNVGGYLFEDSESFKRAYKELSLQSTSELYLSKVVQLLLKERGVWRGIPVKRYLDWGTIKEWEEYLLNFESKK